VVVIVASSRAGIAISASRSDTPDNGRWEVEMPTYKVCRSNGLQEKIIVARNEDHAREEWARERLQAAADHLRLSVAEYRKVVLVERVDS
jgi:hypothetical protein